MRYRLQHQSRWFSSLTFAKARAREAQRGRSVVHVVDETGTVVWSNDELPVVDVTPVHEHVEPQGDLF